MSLSPGWYRDPADPTTQRWWDGEGWVGEPLPADQTPPPGPPDQHTGEDQEEGISQVPAVPGHPGSAEAPPGRHSAPGDAPGGEPGGGEPGRGEPGRGQAGGEPEDGGERPTQTGWRATTGRAAAARQAARQLAQEAREAARRQRTDRPHGYPVASFGARIVARLVDIAAVLALNVVVNGWFVYQYWQEISPVLAEAWQRSLAGQNLSDLPEMGDEAGYLQLVILILAAALWFAYEVPAVANTGQTPGKRLMRLKVVPLEKDQPISFGRSFRRWNPMGLPVLLWWCFGIGFVMQLIDAGFGLFDRPARQTLHDKSAHTAVVSIAAEPSGRPPAPDQGSPADARGDHR